MRRIELLGYFSGVCTTSAFLPQVYTMWMMRPQPALSTSLPMYVIFTIGAIGWAYYGVKTKAQSMVVMNTITTVLALSILIYKCLYG